MRSVLRNLAPLLKDATPLVACAKGIEHGTHKFMTEIAAEHAP
jgi:glycerol-3-phosphate dehydrogenase (NAD(P)+)